MLRTLHRAIGIAGRSAGNWGSRGDGGGEMEPTGQWGKSKGIPVVGCSPTANLK